MTLFKSVFAWPYLIIMLAFVLFSVILALSPWGKTKLGKENDKPEYSLAVWFAMLFGAGMGIGLVFWGVSEPLSHYVAPMAGIEGVNEEAAAFAFRSSFMHWGLQPWACYAIMGLGFAYFQFRKGKPSLVSNLLTPIWGEKGANGAPGKILNIYTVIITAFGVATSLGMGTLQFSGGLEYLFEIPYTVWVWLIIIVVMAVIYLWTAVSGIDKGMKYLSNMNMFLFILLIVLGFIIGPGRDILYNLAVGAKDYVLNYFQDSLRISSEGDRTWINNWRVFYWAWWISWAPFVGIFIARISKGRTIRQFVAGVIIVPTLVSMVWFAVFGTMAIDASGNFTAEQLNELIASPQTAIFAVFGQYDFGTVMSLIALVLLVTFFITSANSATYVLGMLISKGSLNPPNKNKLIWGIAVAVLGFLLILSGSIEAIQNISIMISLPYLFILILIGAAVVIDLARESKKSKKAE